ncbi:MAG: hypothetical protein JWL86_2107 [Rhizobium sp.]|nr:hypothetical protein [Rhizobium sp.]
MIVRPQRRGASCRLSILITLCLFSAFQKYFAKRLRNLGFMRESLAWKLIRLARSLPFSLVLYLDGRSEWSIISTPPPPTFTATS